MVRKASVPTRASSWRTAAEEATAPNTAGGAEPVAAPGAGLVRLALIGAGLPNIGAAAPVDASVSSEETLVEAPATGERVRAQIAAHAIAYGLAGSTPALATTESTILHTQGVAAALAAGEAKVAERLTSGAAALTATKTWAAWAEAQRPGRGTELGGSRADSDGGQNGTGEGACSRAEEVTSGRRASQSTDQAIEPLRVHVSFPCRCWQVTPGLARDHPALGSTCQASINGRGDESPLAFLTPC